MGERDEKEEGSRGSIEIEPFLSCCDSQKKNGKNPSSSVREGKSIYKVSHFSIVARFLF